MIWVLLVVFHIFAFSFVVEMPLLTRLVTNKFYNLNKKYKRSQRRVCGLYARTDDQIVCNLH